MRVEIPEVETERLRLRAPAPRDFESFAGFYASQRARFVGGPLSRTAAWGSFSGMAGHWVLRGYGRWLVADRETDAALGVVGPFHPESWPEPEIAWLLFAHAEGRGLALEAARAARAFAYGRLGWRTAISMIGPANARSAALGERLGCHFERVFEHPDFGALHVWRHPGPDAAGREADQDRGGGAGT